MTPIRRWPFPSGCLLACLAGLVLWGATFLAIPDIIAAGAWAVGLAMNIVGAR